MQRDDVALVTREQIAQGHPDRLPLTLHAGRNPPLRHLAEQALDAWPVDPDDPHVPGSALQPPEVFLRLAKLLLFLSPAQGDHDIVQVTDLA